MKKLNVLAIAALLFFPQTDSIFAESIGNPVAGSGNIENFVQDSFEAATDGTAVLFPYHPHSVYKIYCQEGFLTDISFEKGEKILFAGGGDTSRWLIEKGKVGSDLNAIEHLYIKPTQRGIATNIIINTTKRSYQLNVISASFYNPSVAWIVESEIQIQRQQHAIENYLTMNPENLNFNYSFNQKKWDWAPQRVFDDGKKTYLKMKPEIFTSDAPAFFVLNNKNDIVLVNYRMLNGYYVVDRLFDKAVLKVGKDKITIKREKTNVEN